MIAVLLAGSIAAAVVWRIAENDAVNKRQSTTDRVVDAVKRAVDDNVVTLSGTSALVDDSGRVSQASLDRYAADLADVGAQRPVAWLTPAADGAWTVSLVTPGPDDAASSGLPGPGTTLPAGSPVASAATTARSTGRATVTHIDPNAASGEGSTATSGGGSSRLVVLKPVFRSGARPVGDLGSDDFAGIVASVSPSGRLTDSISSDVGPDVRYSVFDGGRLLAASDPPATGGVHRIVVVDGTRLDARIQDTTPVKHDLSWFLLWISAVVVAAAGTLGLRSARYDEDRRRANTLITRTAELAQHLAQAATADDVADVISERLPPLLGAEVATFGVLDTEGGSVRLHPVPEGHHPILAALTELRIDDVGTIADAVGSGQVVVLRTPGDWRAAFPPAVADELLASGATTAAVIPLEVADRGVIATVGVIWKAAPELDQRMIATLDTVKELGEQTLGRAELTDRVSKHASQLATLAERLATTDNLVEAADTVTAIAPGPVAASAVCVGLRDDDAGVLRLFHRSRAGASGIVEQVALSDPSALTGVVRSGTMVLCRDHAECARDWPDAGDTGLSVAEGGRAVLPLRADGLVIGSIGFGWDHPVAFDVDLVNDLTTLAEMTAQTVRRAQLLDQLRGSVVRNQALAEFAQHLANIRTTDRLFRVVVDHAAGGVGAALADIGLTAEHGPALSLHPDPLPTPALVPVDLSDPDAPALACLRTRSTVMVHGPAELDSRYPPEIRAALDAHGITRTAHVPLFGPDGAVIGVLAVAWDTELDISDTVHAKLSTLAQLCSQTFRRVRLAEAEHRLVVNLQQRVVRPVPPRHGLAIAQRYMPAVEQVGMGGDWYEGIPVDDHRFAVVVGDIAGHGINAIADMVELRAIIGSQLRSPTPLGEVFPRVAALLHMGGRNLTATSCIAVFDTAADTVEYVSAGHLPPVLGRSDGAVELLEAGRQPLLGVPSTPVTVGTATFPPGSVVALYTDGIVERRSESIDESLARIEQAMRRRLAGDVAGPGDRDRGRDNDSDRDSGRCRTSAPAAPIDVEDLADGLLLDCLAGRPADDDVALVVICRTHD